MSEEKKEPAVLVMGNEALGMALKDVRRLVEETKDWNENNFIEAAVPAAEGNTMMPAMGLYVIQEY